MRPDLWTVIVTNLVFITVPTLKMLESLVKVYVDKLDLLPSPLNFQCAIFIVKLGSYAKAYFTYLYQFNIR